MSVNTERRTVKTRSLTEGPDSNPFNLGMTQEQMERRRLQTMQMKHMLEHQIQESKTERQQVKMG